MAPASLDNPEFKRLLRQCIHCGLCLPACPTYQVFGTEMDAPRGRIALMRAAADGRIGLDGPFQEHITLCLACRACETACPSGVRYGLLVETTRIALEQARAPGTLERLVRRVVLREMLPHVGRLRLAARLMRLYQVTGLQRLVRVVDRLPGRLQTMEGLLPRLPGRYPDYRRLAPAMGQKRGTVAFFHGCVQEAFLADVNAATIRVLQRNGYEVHVPTGQTCCGAAQLHVGEVELARELARRNIEAFTPSLPSPLRGGGEDPLPDFPPVKGREYVAIINNAGGCGATLKEYDHLLADDPAYAERARHFVAQVKDISEFLAHHLHEPPKGTINTRVTYVDSCHLRHAQQVAQQPRDLLRMIPGLELVELKYPDHCCGSAGVYNIVHPETANAILDAKMADIAATGAEIIVTTNTGCYMQLLHGVRRAGLKAKVVHLVELLDEAYAQG